VVVKRGDLREKTDKKGFRESDRGMVGHEPLGPEGVWLIDSERMAREV